MGGITCDKKLSYVGEMTVSSRQYETFPFPQSENYAEDLLREIADPWYGLPRLTNSYISTKEPDHLLRTHNLTVMRNRRAKLRADQVTLVEGDTGNSVVHLPVM